MCSLAPKSQWKEVKRRSEWEARDGQRGSAQAPVNGGLGGWGVLSCAWKWDNNHARTSFVNMLVKAFLSEIEKKFNFDKPSFWQKYWEWVNNSANSLIGKWFINQLWFFYICDSAEDTPQMYITYALYHHKGIPTTSSRTLLLHNIADATMGKSVECRGHQLKDSMQLWCRFTFRLGGPQCGRYVEAGVEAATLCYWWGRYGQESVVRSK